MQGSTCAVVKRDFGRAPHPSSEEVLDQLTTQVILDPHSRETRLMFLDPMNMEVAGSADWQTPMLQAATYRSPRNAVDRIEGTLTALHNCRVSGLLSERAQEKCAEDITYGRGLLRELMADLVEETQGRG